MLFVLFYDRFFNKSYHVKGYMFVICMSSVLMSLLPV